MTTAFREEGAGENILYLHGFPSSSYLWRDVMKVTATRYRAVAPDMPGFGDSEPLPGPHGWRDLVAWLDVFVDEHALSPVHLAVHDWGGLIGLPWFCENPGKVRSLLITDTSFSSRDRWHALAQQWRAPGTGEEALGAITREGFAGLIGMTATEPIAPSAVDEYWKSLATEPRRAAKLQMYRSLDFSMFEPYMEPFPRLAAGKTRLVWGGQDPFVPPKTGERLSTLLGAELTVLPLAGHFLQEDAGEELGNLHLEFLDSAAM